MRTVLSALIILLIFAARNSGGVESTTSLSRPAHWLMGLLERPKRPVVPGASARAARVATESNRPLLGWISHPLVLRAIVAH